MGDVYRETRWRERGDSPSEDDYKSNTTVRRYKVAPGRYDRTVEVEDDRRSRYSGPDRPRSAFDGFGGQPGPDRTTRSVYYEHEVEREPARPVAYEREPERDARSRVSAWETKEVDREWDSRFHQPPEDDMKMVRRVDRRDNGDYVVEKRWEDRHEDAHGCEVERIQKETEYYTPAEPAPPPIIIRQRAPEPQKIIVQEAPAPAPVIVPRQDPGGVVIREKEPAREMVRREPREEEYYYRHERRDTGGHRGDRDYAIERYHRRGEHGYHSDDEDYYVRRTVVRRDRSRSESAHHKRHLAEGALAGAGLTALLNSRRDEYGDLPDNRGRKVFAGAALGALGTEAFRRARSAYEDRWDEDDSSPDRHSTLKKGLGIAAVALAAAGAAKYYQSNKVEKEEALRGRSRQRSRSRYVRREEHWESVPVSQSRSHSRSRRRSLSTAAKAALGTAATAGLVKHLRNRSKSRASSRSPSRSSRSRSRSHSRLSTAAKAALGTAATAGLVKHMRNRSKSRASSTSSSRSRSGSRSRSKSRVRRAAEIGTAAAAAGIANKMWKKHKEKKEGNESYSNSDDDEYFRRRRRSSRSRSRSRSMARSIHSERGTDPELGLVEYGNGPLRTEPPANIERSYEAEAAERRRRRRRKHDRDPSRSSSTSDHERKRSKSRLRDMAAAGAAAIGINEYKDKKYKKDKKDKKDREQERSQTQESRERSRSRDRRTSRDVPRQRSSDGRYSQPHSPPMASGGAYYPPYPTGPSPGLAGSYANFPTQPDERQYHPYTPADYTGYAPPPPGQPPATASGAASGYPPPPAPPGPPPTGGGQIPPDHVSDTSQSVPEIKHGKDEDGIGDPSPASHDEELPQPSKSVVFIPLSPKSSRTMRIHREQQAEAAKMKELEEQKSSHHEHGFDNESSRSPTENTSSSGRHRRRRDDSTNDDENVEYLPDRFNDRGEPLDTRSSSRRRLSSRSGNFERQPKHPGDIDIKGSWQIAGTDDEMVERLVRGVTGVLEGKQNWVGLLGDVLSGNLEGRSDRQIEDGEDKRRRRRKHQR